jgi:hypothetical protein
MKKLLAALIALAAISTAAPASANEWTNAWAPSSSTPQASNTIVGTTNGADIVNNSGAGGILVIDVTAIAGASPSVVFKVQVKDPVSLKYVDLPGAATTAFVATGTQMIVIHPGVTAAANVSVSTTWPEVGRIVATFGGTTTTITFTAGLQEMTN